MEKRIDDWIKGTILNEKENNNIPVPRLEIRYFDYKSNGYNLIAIYSLIYKHLLGDIINIPFGHTKIDSGRGTPVYEDGTLDMPFRDGAHIKNEMLQLNLPAYVIYNDINQVI